MGSQEPLGMLPIQKVLVIEQFMISQNSVINDIISAKLQPDTGVITSAPAPSGTNTPSPRHITMPLLEQEQIFGADFGRLNGRPR